MLTLQSHNFIFLLQMHIYFFEKCSPPRITAIRGGAVKSFISQRCWWCLCFAMWKWGFSFRMMKGRNSTLARKASRVCLTHNHRRRRRRSWEGGEEGGTHNYSRNEIKIFPSCVHPDCERWMTGAFPVRKMYEEKWRLCVSSSSFSTSFFFFVQSQN